jgi:hypothetical protein
LDIIWTPWPRGWERAASAGLEEQGAAQRKPPDEGRMEYRFLTRKTFRAKRNKNVFQVDLKCIYEPRIVPLAILLVEEKMN